MERRPKEEGPEGQRRRSIVEEQPSDIFVISEQIRAITAFNARASLDDEKQLLLFLKSWWSTTYNRPLKDPLLQTYSVEELLYEFYDRIERIAADKERLEQESDKIETDKEKSALDWAEQEERKELEALEAKKGEAVSEETVSPLEDPNNVKWMQEQIDKAKSIYGESFGEDIKEDFEE